MSTHPSQLAEVCTKSCNGLPVLLGGISPRQQREYYHTHSSPSSALSSHLASTPPSTLHSSFNLPRTSTPPSSLYPSFLPLPLLPPSTPHSSHIPVHYFTPLLTYFPLPLHPPLPPLTSPLSLPLRRHSSPPLTSSLLPSPTSASLSTSSLRRLCFLYSQSSSLSGQCVYRLLFLWIRS